MGFCFFHSFVGSFFYSKRRIYASSVTFDVDKAPAALKKVVDEETVRRISVNIRKSNRSPEDIEFEKLFAMRFHLSNEHVLLNFTLYMYESEKRSLFECFEELETLKKITPSSKSLLNAVGNSSSKQPTVLSSSSLHQSQDDDNFDLDQFNQPIYYNYKTILSSSRKLYQVYKNSSSPKVVHEDGDQLLTALGPLLQYRDSLISLFVLHTIISTCQDNLLKCLISDFDQFMFLQESQCDNHMAIIESEQEHCDG